MQKKTQGKILQQRREAFLQEILSEALSILQDDRINSLEITHVKCSKGKHDAKIFINKNNLTQKEQQEIQNIFKKAKPILQEYVLAATSWYAAPNLSLEFDESFEVQTRLDKIFEQIHKNKILKG